MIDLKKTLQLMKGNIINLQKAVSALADRLLIEQIEIQGWFKLSFNNITQMVMLDF